MLLTKLYLVTNGYNDESIKMEIFKLIEQLIESGFGTDLSLCHGDMGSLHLLMYAANVMGDYKLKEECINTINDIANNFAERNWKK